MPTFGLECGLACAQKWVENGAATLSVMTLRIMALSIMTLIMITLRMRLGVTIFRILKLSITVL
jgi:hypothetical protein